MSNTIKAVLLFATLFVIFGGVILYYFDLSQSPPTGKDDGVVNFFPENDKTSTNVSTESPTPSESDLSFPDKVGKDVGPSISQGGLSPLLPHQVDYLREVIMKSQEVPSPTSGEKRYAVAQTPLYETYVVILPTGDALVDVTLKQAPYALSRMYAESEFAQLFNGERDDLCGFPFNIHVDSDPLLKERGNLGLEYCGANTLGENE
ncbi:MAG: hypothetical protein KBD21_02840 [Candidatus Pacebacteria bacterium]|nr:hypothetical protein [Candidatus Paceibacterota bacterium]